MPELQWDLRGWNPPSQLTADQAKGRIKFESLSPTLLLASPVSRFRLPVLSRSPSTYRVWQTNFGGLLPLYIPLAGGRHCSNRADGWAHHSSSSAQSFSLTQSSFPQQFNPGQWVAPEAAEMQGCVPCCWCGMEQQRCRWRCKVDSPGLFFSFCSLWAWAQQSSLSAHNSAVGTPSRAQSLTS